MVESTTCVTMPQMVDLALNCPEIGSFNFNILHTLLHVVLKIAGHEDIALEFRGPDSEKIQNLITASKPSPVPLLSKYNIIGVKGSFAKSKKATKKISLKDIKEQSKQEVTKEEELRVIDPRKNSKDDPDAHPPPIKSPPTSHKNIIVVDSSSQLPQFSVAMSKEHFDTLEEEVNYIKKKVKELCELPANMGLIEATRKQSGPILDMFQILNLTKRMDACETGMEKLVTLIEDLARGDMEVMDKVKDTKSAIHEKQSATRFNELELIEKRLNMLEKAVHRLNQTGGKTVVVKKIIKEKKKVEEQSDSGPMTLDVDEDEDKVSVNAEKGEIIEASLDEDVSSLKRVSTLKEEMPKYNSAITGITLAEVPPAHAMKLIQEELENVKKWIEDNEFLSQVADAIDDLRNRLNIIEGVAVGGGADPNAEPSDLKMNLIEAKFSDCIAQLHKLDKNYNNQINAFQEQLLTVQKEVTDLIEKINTILPGGDAATAEGESAAELFSKLAAIEQDMSVVSDLANKLQEEKEHHAKNLEIINEQIDLLKIMKANREDLEDALGDKADACLINRKVSHDQFDAAYEDLSRGIEEALSKLSEQQEMWHQALNAIHREVGGKLDKSEVSPLKDFVNNKLKALQDKFRALTALKREQEAAGTKSKFLRNVACISCDKDVVMRKEMDPSLKPQPYAMPPNKNIAPYLAYELDQLRKQQKCVPGSKNLNFYENALKSKAAANNKNHLCNRYCGGSHTVTTPQQRVTRMGHFLEQWGPEISPVNDEYVKGKDNQMYKARDDAILNKLKQEAQSLTAKKVNSGRGDDSEKTIEPSVASKSEGAPPRKMSSKQNAGDAGDNTVTKDVNDGQPRLSTSSQRKSSLSKGKVSLHSDQNVLIDAQAREIIANKALHTPLLEERKSDVKQERSDSAPETVSPQ